MTKNIFQTSPQVVAQTFFHNTRQLLLFIRSDSPGDLVWISLEYDGTGKLGLVARYYYASSSSTTALNLDGRLEWRAKHSLLYFPDADGLGYVFRVGKEDAERVRQCAASMAVRAGLQLGEGFSDLEQYVPPRTKSRKMSKT